MLRVWMASGVEHAVALEQLADSERTAERPVLALKQHLSKLCGVPRFRQRLLCGSTCLQDCEKLEPSQELQLVLLPFAETSSEQGRGLCRAAMQGQEEEVERMLSLPQDPEAQELDLSDLSYRFHMITPLLATSGGGSIAVARLLLEARAHPDKGSETTTPLVKACRMGHVEVAQALLQAGADKDKCGECGFGNLTPLAVSAELGQVELVRILLDARADPDKYGDVDVTPLARACRHGSEAVARLLLAAGAEKDKDGRGTFRFSFAADTAKAKAGWTPLVEAAQYGHGDVVQLLLEAKADKDKFSHGCTALGKACEYGYVEVGRLLLQHSADPDKASGHITPLTWAVRQGTVELAKLLLDAGACTGQDSDNLTPLACAARKGDCDMALLLLEFKANVDLGYFKPLLEASQQGHPTMTSLLLQARADPNAGCWMPLVEAAQAGHVQVVHQLLAARADTEKCGNSDLTALAKAVESGRTDIVDLLVDSACLRLEKRVRLLPEEELEKLCGDCYTLGTSHLSRVKDFKVRALAAVADAEAQALPAVAAQAEDNVKRALSLRSRERNQMIRMQGLNSEGAWSRQADIPSDHESDREAPSSSDEEQDESATPPPAPSFCDISPSKLGAPALLDVACEALAGSGRVPANSPAVSASLSRPSASRFARGAATKEDWTRLVHKANTFILRSYVAMAEREPITKYVEEATRAFLDAWEFGSLKEDPVVAQLILDKVKGQYNKHLSKALACLDLQSVDDLRAAAEGSAGYGPEIQLMEPAVAKMMTYHSRYLLQMAMAMGDRKALALALVESCRLMGDLPDAALWQPVAGSRPEADDEDKKDVEAKEEEKEEEKELAAKEMPEAHEEVEFRGTLSGPCAFDGGPGMPEGELQRRPNTPARSVDSADLVLADPGPLWSSLHRSFAEGGGPSPTIPARSCAQLLQLAREMYRQKLFDESRQLLLTEAARELLGDGLDHFGEAWMQQQLSVMRSKQVGSLDPRSKRELESPKFIRALQALFDLTTRQVITRDRQGKLPTRLKVVKAKRSVNLDAYRAYYARRTETLLRIVGSYRP
ncbi:ANKRD17 [Symbiodinium natans]|uniref:ANKRD17 protein n=1 Tax=Symbiodinium natans TaxID=878477 RepID=A0A812HTP1_9DINO|nr:ANKRD17 [Symbiodinium natans]